jgi:SSS family transporter
MLLQKSLSPDQVPIFWIVLIAYLAVLIVFGLYSQKKTKSTADFLIAGRSIGPWLLGLSFGVTYFSSVMIVGGGGYTYVFGFGVMWIVAIDILVGVVLMFVFFGRRTKILSAKSNSLTVPHLIGFRYQDRKFQAFSGLVVMFFETIYLVSVYMGLSYLLTLLTPGDPEVGYMIGVAACAIITIAYLVVGGAHGAILSDAAESLIMVVGVILIFIFGLIAVGGVNGMLQGLTDLDPINNGYLEFPGRSGMGIIGFVLVTSFGVWGMPQQISRFFTAKAKKTMKWGLVVACIWASVVAFFAWFNGAIATAYWEITGDTATQTYLGTGTNRDFNIPFFLIEATPFWLGAIFLAAVTAASMTTGEKLILVAASGFTVDVYQNIMEMKKQQVPDEKMLKLTRLVTIFVIAGALLLALTKPSFVLDLCMFAWSAMAATILIPFTLGLFWKRGTAKAAWISGIAALATAIVWWLLFKYPNADFAAIPWIANIRAFVITNVPFKVTFGSIHEFIMSQIVAFVVFVVVSLVTKKPEKEFVEEIFNDFKMKKRAVTPAKSE